MKKEKIVTFAFISVLLLSAVLILYSINQINNDISFSPLEQKVIISDCSNASIFYLWNNVMEANIDNIISISYIFSDSCSFYLYKNNSIFIDYMKGTITHSNNLSELNYEAYRARVKSVATMVNLTDHTLFHIDNSIPLNYSKSRIITSTN